ncbi:hypothetical protein ASZ90_009303 [hydrocarbon metagenome]|uniref:Uncharacterized protein n=1 Tax=hydrocarbon metagenome TaxID=938273 RepID=A0A0W8FJX5_9ZZZZ
MASEIRGAPSRAFGRDAPPHAASPHKLNIGKNNTFIMGLPQTGLATKT